MERLRLIRRDRGRQGSAQRTRPPISVPNLLPLRGPERRMAQALDQLRAGVPLNWTQLEDDPELATLSYLDQVANEYRGQPLNYTPPALRESVFADLSKRLPKPKPVAVKEAPRSLAGFSESVPVLTQAEEQVPALVSRAPQIAGAIALVAGLLFLLSWGINALASPPTGNLPAYRWIEVEQGGKALSRLDRPGNWGMPVCNGYNFGDTSVKREYISIPDTRQVQSNIGFPVAYLPKSLVVSESLTSTATYVIGLSSMGIATCEQAFSPDDRGASVKIDYMANQNSGDGVTRITPFTFFQARQMPATLDVGTGKWKEVTIGGAHGVYWQGGPYVDMAGNRWIGDVSVMMVERGESVLILAGQGSQGITESFLTEAVESIDAERQAEENLKSEAFTWIDIWRGSQLLLARKLPDDWKEADCATNGASFARIRNHDVAKELVDYPIVKLPAMIPGPKVIARQRDEGAPSRPITATREMTVTLATTYTVRLVDMWVQKCSQDVPDADGKVKMRYTVTFTTERPVRSGPVPDIVLLQDSNVPLVSDVVLFQTRRLPTSFYVEGGQWKEVTIGDARGIYWSGSQYRDAEGLFWQDGANVLVIERGEMVVTLVSRVSPETLLMSLAENIEWDSLPNP